MAKGQNEFTHAMCMAAVYARKSLSYTPVAAGVIWLALLPFA